MEKMLCSKEDREAEEDKSVRVIWEYLCLRHDLTSRHSVIVCLGSNDIRAAQHSAELYHKGLAPWLLFTGGMGTGMHSGANLLSWTEPEARVCLYFCLLLLSCLFTFFVYIRIEKLKRTKVFV